MVKADPGFDATPIATVMFDESQEAAAVTRLLAASPQMRDALRLAAEYIGELERDDEPKPEALQAVRQALWLATGEYEVGNGNIPHDVLAGRRLAELYSLAAEAGSRA